MKRLGLLVLMVGCTAGDLGEVEQNGTTAQGTTAQGTTAQGTTAQGTTAQGTTAQGATYGGSAASSGTISGTSIVIWTWNPGNFLYPWQQRFPNRICNWTATKTFSSCSNVDLSTSPSPLAGATFPSTFTKADGSTVSLQLRIGSNTSTVGAVAADNSDAMYLISSASGGIDHRTTTCGNPNGCTINSDLWLYDVQLIDSDGSAHALCPNGARAIALRGTWDATATVVDSPVTGAKFTFACTGGTIAKCTRWGYRPWASATTSNALYPGTAGSTVALAPYHEACVRAAMADYCGIARSFTTTGTLIDIYDYEPQQWYWAGLIPRTLSLHFTDVDPPTAFAQESQFDIYGATQLDFTRHEELATSSSPDDVCPGKFSLPTAPDTNFYDMHQPYVRTSPAAVAPWVFIDSTPACAHSEQTLGKFLHYQCSECTRAIYNGGDPALAHCTRGDGTWDQTCVSAATTMCSNYQTSSVTRMATHSECATSTVGLSLYDSGCTLAVCGDPAHASCCTASGWTSACVDAANASCRGGRESLFDGFCGTPYSPGNTL